MDTNTTTTHNDNARKYEQAETIIKAENTTVAEAVKRVGMTYQQFLYQRNKRTETRGKRGRRPTTVAAEKPAETASNVVGLADWKGAPQESVVILMGKSDEIKSILELAMQTRKAVAI